MKETPTADDVLVTTPPPTELKTTAPLTVAIAVSPGAVDGAIRMVVGAGTVDARIKDETASETVAATVATVLGVVTEAAVVVPLVCLFAIYTSLLARTGFVECTCSIAALSLLKTPSRNLGDRLCSTECRTLLSIESMMDDSLPQSTNESSLWCGAANTETAMNANNVSNRCSPSMLMVKRLLNQDTTKV